MKLKADNKTLTSISVRGFELKGKRGIFDASGMDLTKDDLEQLAAHGLKPYSEDEVESGEAEVTYDADGLPNERPELVKLAEELGVEVKPRMGIDALKADIREAKAKAAEAEKANGNNTDNQ